MNRLLLVLVAALLVTGCGVLDSPATSTTTTDPAIGQPDPPPATISEIDSGDGAPCLAGDRPFAADGVISAFGGANGDATQVAGIRWASHPGCERVVVDLLTADGAPAGAIDPVGVDYNAAVGVIRINLPPAISRSAISDSLLDGDLIHRAYVVATADGRVAIDIHTAAGSSLSLRAFEVASPSRIVIDVRPEDDAAKASGSAFGAGIVVTSPQPTETATTVLVSGYARGPGDDLLIRAFPAGDTSPISEQTVELVGESNLWREFALELVGLPARPLEIAVGFNGADIDDAALVTLDTSDRQIPDPPEV
jgi:hypothetical protein